MPSAPEFFNCVGKIGKIEILHNVESQNLATTDCHIGIPAEITIYLEAVEQGR